MNRKTTREQFPWKTIALMALAGVLACAAAWWLENNTGNTETVSGLRISEVMADSDPADSDWIEIENTSETEIHLYGYALMSAAEPKKSFVFPNCTIEAGGFLVVTADGSNEGCKDGVYHAPFKLSSGSATIYLLNAAGSVLDTAEVPGMGDNQVYARDENGDWQMSYKATPNAKNVIQDLETVRESEVAVVSGVLEISEVSSKNRTFYPDEDGEISDYVEIHNTTSETVSLKGWYLSNQKENLKRWAFPDIDLEADGYLVVHMSGLNEVEDGHVHAGFKLLSSGTSVYLTNKDGETVSGVTVPEMQADQSYSKTDTGWQDALVPTPGQENGVYVAQTADSEIYLSEISATNSTGVDWIEIVNTSSSAVDLSGWGLSDNAARPRKWQFADGTTIQPGAYLLVLADGDDKLDAATRAKFNMPVADFSLSASGGYSVVLSQSDGKIVDRLFVPQQYSDISFGRTLNWDGAYMEVMTPETRNDLIGYAGRAEAPEFSACGGLFASGETLTVSLSAPADCRIYYTTDDTEPTEQSTLYTADRKSVV